jgi:hypothetical protein
MNDATKRYSGLIGMLLLILKIQFQNLPFLDREEFSN